MIARPASPQVQAAAAAGSIARSIRLGEPNWPNLPQMPPTQLLPKRRGQLAPTYAFARHLAIGVGMDGQRPCRTLAEDPGRTQPRAAYPRRRSSNANGLQSQNSAGFPQIYAIFQRDNLRRHF